MRFWEFNRMKCKEKKKKICVLVMRLFHMLMTYIQKTLTKCFADAGLQDVAEGSVDRT